MRLYFSFIFISKCFYGAKTQRNVVISACSKKIQAHDPSGLNILLNRRIFSVPEKAIFLQESHFVVRLGL